MLRLPHAKGALHGARVELEERRDGMPAAVAACTHCSECRGDACGARQPCHCTRRQHQRDDEAFGAMLSRLASACWRKADRLRLKGHGQQRTRQTLGRPPGPQTLADLVLRCHLIQSQREAVLFPPAAARGPGCGRGFLAGGCMQWAPQAASCPASAAAPCR